MKKIGSYDFLRLRGESELFRIYEFTKPRDGKVEILKIATSPEHNSFLDREALVLRALREEADRLEREYEPHRKFVAERLNYPIAFPAIVDTFICKDEGDCRATVMDLSASARALGDLSPLAFIIEKDKARVDPKTSAWMMGKLLKLLTFTHSVGVTVGEWGISPDTLTVNSEEHSVVLLDWTAAEFLSDGVPDHVASREIGEAAQSVIAVLGGSLEDQTIPEDEQLPDNRYANLLFSLANYESSDARAAHVEFYRLVDDLWPGGGFHKFRGYSLQTGRVQFE